jgi:hypothetical protein
MTSEERKRVKSKAYAALAFGVTLSTVCLLALPPYWREIAGNLLGVVCLASGAAVAARWAIGRVK